MTEETKKALEEYKKAKKKADELLGCLEEYDSAKNISYSETDTEATADAVREQV